MDNLPDFRQALLQLAELTDAVRDLVRAVDRRRERLRRRRRVRVEDPDWLSVDQAAKLANLRPTTVRRAAHNGTLPASDVSVRPGRRHWRIRRQDVLDWLAARRVVVPVPAREPGQAAQAPGG